MLDPRCDLTHNSLKSVKKNHLPGKCYWILDNKCVHVWTLSTDVTRRIKMLVISILVVGWQQNKDKRFCNKFQSMGGWGYTNSSQTTTVHSLGSNLTIYQIVAVLSTLTNTTMTRSWVQVPSSMLILVMVSFQWHLTFFQWLGFTVSQVSFIWFTWGWLFYRIKTQFGQNPCKELTTMKNEIMASQVFCVPGRRDTGQWWVLLYEEPHI